MTTRQMLFALLLMVGAFVGFMGYCYAWMDWVDDVQTGVYRKNYLEAAGETSALGLYTYLAIRFVKRNVTL
ncbi:hypothetical protein [Spirosoma pollinicola]|uniref:Uncharacterized protein n=1 Tax=Spirosoma pollinicola TaxID=2057025 RepID=A0A2K8YSG9_9BACT|nr:hypothetical protein [Spirosoma pollinicola]AUD00573.1 hypothetical protein CWM47_01305 [Spirosoma pollinicola]